MVPYCGQGVMSRGRSWATYAGHVTSPAPVANYRVCYLWRDTPHGMLLWGSMIASPVIGGESTQHHKHAGLCLDVTSCMMEKRKPTHYQVSGRGWWDGELKLCQKTRDGLSAIEL